MSYLCNEKISCNTEHCVKNIPYLEFSGPHFPAFTLNTEKYRVSLRFHCKCGKMRNRITLNTEIVYAVEA